jgi:hypothetical protein
MKTTLGRRIPQKCENIKAMKAPAEMIEGPEAWERFQAAMKKLVSTPKSTMPPSPYKKTAAKKKQPAKQKRADLL